MRKRSLREKARCFLDESIAVFDTTTNDGTEARYVAKTNDDHPGRFYMKSSVAAGYEQAVKLVKIAAPADNDD